MQSLEWSRRQAARAWELRTAVDLAALLAAQGRPKDAQALLQPVFEQFVEGSDTADLQAAGRLLASLGGSGDLPGSGHGVTAKQGTRQRQSNPARTASGSS